MSTRWVLELVGAHSPVKQLFPTPPEEGKGGNISVIQSRFDRETSLQECWEKLRGRQEVRYSPAPRTTT